MSPSPLLAHIALEISGLVLMAGLTSMVQAAYNDNTEFFVLDQLDPQKLYNSTTKVEITVWKLSNERNPNNEIYLLSNSLDGERPRNLSYERLFGKNIAAQDAMAKILAQREIRTIRAFVQRIASTAVFLPI